MKYRNVFLSLLLIGNLAYALDMRVSSEGTKTSKLVKDSLMVPRGSAVITDSGLLKKTGITHIIHAATGSMTRSGSDFEPSLEGIDLSIKNALILAKNNKHKSLAIPFLGGGIFLGSLGSDKKKLADFIIQKTADHHKGKLDIKFVTWSEEDTKIFESSLNALKDKKFKRHANVVKGSITDFKTHHCTVIVNAANMEIAFGGGLSGVIGKATGVSNEIDKSAKEIIKAYYKD